MEKEYCDHNRREYELTKHFSLRYHFPMEFLRLKDNGTLRDRASRNGCSISTTPGHYMRRIKNVTLTIPCVTGPYNGCIAGDAAAQHDAHRSAT